MLTEVNWLSQEQVLKTLANLGFDEVEAQIYVYLAKKGIRKASEILQATKLTKQQLYPSIKRLQSKSIVTSTMEHPARFSVMPFEKVLDVYIQAKMEEAKKIEQSKAEILSNWKNLKLEDNASSKFTVIEGRTFIYSKIQQMIQETKDQILAITTVPALLQADQRDIFDSSHINTLKSKIRFRFLVELSEQNVNAVKAFLAETKKANLKVEGRNPDMGLTLFPHMLVRDGEETIFFVNPRTETSLIEKTDVCLWTDCKTLVTAFTAVFEDLWRGSTDIQDKITEIETDRLVPKTFFIGNVEVAKKKYKKSLASAKEEILIITSAKGLCEFGQNIPQHNEWAEKGVAVKIMAPIVNENLETSKQLSNICSVKHVPPNYLPTTIIDGKHLFQFKQSATTKHCIESSPLFEDTLYTNDSDYVQKTKSMLDEIWKHSNSPSANSLKSIFGAGVLSQSSSFTPGAIRAPGPEGRLYPIPPDPATEKKYPVIEIVDDDPFRRLREQDVLNEIMCGQKNPPKKKMWKVFSSQAIAIINPPDFFNLPSMLIRAHHFDKHSTFGQEDVIMISLWLKTSTEYAYVPVAVFGDNPNAKSIWETHFSATPACRNVQLAKEGEIQTRVHGNAMFIGWTVPIQLFPIQYFLPPAYILIEGYGDVKTVAYTTIGPEGVELKAKQNGFDAFVTFMHPSSKYTGPGTDGFFVRDFIGEIRPNIFKDHPPTMETRLKERKL
jgi:sugar-specific transcriptional regulator TrmB